LRKKKEQFKEEEKEKTQENEKKNEEFKNIFHSSFENIKDFVDKNGGIENIFNIFKDDLHVLKSNFFSTLKSNCPVFRNHCERRKEECKEKKQGKCENVENFKKKLEKKLDKTLKKLKEKLLRKMVKKYEKLAKNQSKSVFSDMVHEGVACDGCNVSPIKGIRYKCTVCRNFDYCEKCEENNVQHDHTFLKIKRPVEIYNFPIRSCHQNSDNKACHQNSDGKAVHRGVTCDGCKTHPIRGIRYKCTVCHDFDYCEDCKAKNVDHKHEFKKIEDPINHCRRNETSSDGRVLHFGVKCDGCGTKPVKGIRYKCSVCPNFDYCEDCKAKFTEHKHEFQKIEVPVQRGGFHNFVDNLKDMRCNFFKNFFGNNQCQNQEAKKEEQKENSKEQKTDYPEKKEEPLKEESGYDFLVKEIKEMYQLHQFDDKVILEALKKANGDVEQAMTIIFS